jgi:hypothetical protein
MHMSLRLPVPFSGQTPWAQVRPGAAISIVTMSVQKHFRFDIVERAPQRARHFALGGTPESTEMTGNDE